MNRCRMCRMLKKITSNKTVCKVCERKLNKIIYEGLLNKIMHEELSMSFARDKLENRKQKRNNVKNKYER